MSRPEIWLESTHTLSARGRGRTGVGHYTEELIANLAAVNPEHTYTVVGNVFMTAEPHLPPAKPAGKLRFRLSRLFPGKVWNQLFKRGLMLPLNVLIPGRPDVVVFFNFVRYPLTPGVRSIVTVHDLTFRHFPERVQERNRRYLTRFVPRALERADHIIAVSEYTKQDIHETYGTALERISVVPPGVDLHKFRPGLETKRVRAKLKLPEAYFLFVSTIEPRKNVPGLLAAYRALPEAVRRRYALVLAGKVDWQVDAVLADIRAGDPVGKVVYLSYVDDQDLPGLYAGARAFVLPSHFEGFGMPALEAMACGVPVLTSDNSSLPEIVQGAGLMEPAEDTAAFTAAMERLATDNALRTDLARKGRARAEEFTWEHSARKLAAVIDRALEQ